MKPSSFESSGRKSFSNSLPSAGILSSSPESLHQSSLPNGDSYALRTTSSSFDAPRYTAPHHASTLRHSSDNRDAQQRMGPLDTVGIASKLAAGSSESSREVASANGHPHASRSNTNSSELERHAALPNGHPTHPKSTPSGMDGRPHARTFPLAAHAGPELSSAKHDQQRRGARSPGLRVNSHEKELSRRSAPYPSHASASSKLPSPNQETNSRAFSFEAGPSTRLSNGHLSPSPITQTNHRRRGSQTLGGSLGRRISRSVNSEVHLDDPPAVAQDEDSSRLTETIRRQREKRRRRKEDDDDDDRVLVGTKVDQNHVNWITAYNMLTGIRFSVSKTTAKLDRELSQADFQETNKFSFDITGGELTPGAKYDFKFKDYSPWVFRHLRRDFGIDPADYLISLTSKYILSELGSPGKSGSFFYFSRDYKYIIKTIHHAEHKTLRSVLHRYYNHAHKYPNTLLSQFYGLHRVKLPYGRKIHFVVMNNLFPPHLDIHTTFDLKGSTVGRLFSEDAIEKHPRAVLKDLNWTRRNMHLDFGPTKKQNFVTQLERDVQLLEELKIMDYSLLVGVHDLQRGNEENLRDKTLQVFQPEPEEDETIDTSVMSSDTVATSGAATASDQQNLQPLARAPSKLESDRKAKELRRNLRNQRPTPMGSSSSRMPEELPADTREGPKSYFYSDDGGFQATHEDDGPGDEVYYLGIIDCLTKYNIVKKSEHFFKGFTQKRDEISAVPPQAYGTRFLRFMKNICVPRRTERTGTGSTAGVDADGHKLPRVEE
ncbi:MAG: Phosphatidylinositol-4-phosphate 5-kinase [Chrysothrix sp. TS-e1954]|nr:MAG: Phosphatidylinositol-4-phosphate 5-kinase [Chrysothrix sp. TS-e1954]